MRERTQTEFAVDFLRRALADGRELPAMELERLARTAGLLSDQQRIGATKSFVTARRLLGVLTRQKGRRWHWRLPDGAGHPGWQAISESKPREPSDAARTVYPPEGTSHVPRSSTARYRAGTDATGAEAIEEWSEGLTTLDVLLPPAGIPGARWAAFIPDAHAFLEHWGVRAMATRWSAEALFGIDPARGVLVSDRLGLVWTIQGGRVVELDGGGAMVQRGFAARFHARPRWHPSICLPWRVDGHWRLHGSELR